MSRPAPRLAGTGGARVTAPPLTGERPWEWALTPTVAFAVLWALGVLLAQVHVLTIQSSWSLTVWLVMGEVPAAFVAGGLAARRWAGRRAPATAVEPAEVRLPIRWLIGLLAIGAVGLTYEFARAGTIPLFAAHVDSARVALNGGVSALLTDGLAVAGAAAIAIPRRLVSREGVPAVAIAALAAGGMGLAGGRGTVLLPIAAGLLARWLYWRPPAARTLVAAGLLIGGFVSLLFYVRTSQNPPAQAFPAELFGSVVPRTPAPLIPLLPLHFALAMNFEALARVIDFFPGHMAYGHGVYDAYALHAILPARPLGTVSAGLSAPWLASTAAGPLWADGGPLVVAAGMFLFGALTSAPHAVFTRSRRLSHALLAGYFLYIAVFGLYTSLITQYKDWVLIAAGLLVVGWVSEGAPTIGNARPDRAHAHALRAGLRLARVGAIAGLAVALGVAIVAASDRGVSRQQAAAIAASEHVSLGGSPVGSAASLLTSTDLRGAESPLWAVARTRGGVRLTRYTRAGPGAYTATTRILRVRVTPATGYGVAQGRLYLFDAAGRTVSVRALATGARAGAAAVAGRASVAPPQAGAVRAYFIGHWSGARPDLFVVDYGSKRIRLSVSIYSGDSRFTRTVLATATRVHGLDPSNWVVRLARLDAKADLVLVARRAPSGFSEVHVLTGEAGFQRYTTQARLAIPSGERTRDAVVVGDVRGAPSLLAVARPPGDRVDAYPLAPAHPRP